MKWRKSCAKSNGSHNFVDHLWGDARGSVAVRLGEKQSPQASLDLAAMFQIRAQAGCRRLRKEDQAPGAVFTDLWAQRHLAMRPVNIGEFQQDHFLTPERPIIHEQEECLIPQRLRRESSKQDLELLIARYPRLARWLAAD